MKLSWRVARSCRLIDALKSKVDSSYSARFIKRALEANVCRVNGRIERFASASIQPGDRIELVSHWHSFESKDCSCPIIYEDDELLAINKPPNTVCTDHHLSKMLGRSVFLAHRLDKDTTGVLLLGKNRTIALELQDCFEKEKWRRNISLLSTDRLGSPRESFEATSSKKGLFRDKLSGDRIRKAKDSLQKQPGVVWTVPRMPRFFSAGHQPEEPTRFVFIYQK